MSNAYHNLAAGNFSQDWTNSGLLTTDNNWDLVPSIVGYRGDELTASTGTDPSTLTAPGLGPISIDADSGNINNTTASGGLHEFSGLANPVVALNGSGTADAPSLVLYMNASGRQNVRVQAVLRDVDASTDSAVQPIAVQYRTNPAGNWINVTGGFYADVTTGGTATQTTAVDLTLPAGANNAATLEVRFITANAAGNDEFVGIDDIQVSSVPVGNSATLSVADVSITEGDNGTSLLTFTVTRSNDTTAFSVDYGTADGTATTAGSDYAAASGTLSFAAGDSQLSQTVSVTINGDTTVEATEALLLNLSNIVATTGSTTFSDSSATGTITNDDVSTDAGISIGDISISEGDAGTSVLTFTVTRSDNLGWFEIDFDTSDASASAGSDYVATSGVLIFTVGGALTETINVTINGDTAVETNETFAVTLSNLVNNINTASFTDAVATGTINNDDSGVLTTLISAIQGTSFFSPIVAAAGITAFNQATTATVTVKAVVTAIDSFGSVAGFYLSEEVSDWDNNPFTSEGIFVRTSSATAGLTVGETVTVTAQVMEHQDFSNLNRTFLVNPTIVQDNNSVALPTLVLDGTPGRAIPNSVVSNDNPDFTDSVDDIGDSFDPANDALDFYETIEGMRVTVTDMVVADGFVGGSNPNFVFFNAYSNDHAAPERINSRGGYTITGDAQFYPGDTATTTDDVLNGGRNNTDGIVNPDILELDFGNVGRGGAAAFDELLTMGDSLGDVTGILDFDFGTAKLYVTDALDPLKVAALGGSPSQEVTTLTADARSLRFATFNVENLSPVGTTFSTNNGVEITTQAKFDLLAQHIDVNLDAPDIIAIQEVQDNNGVGAGGTEADVTWDALVAAVNLATGKVYQWVDEAPAIANTVGGAPGANIRVGFLYDTGRVSLGNLAANASLADRRQFTDRIGDGVRDAGDLIAVDDSMVAGITPGDWDGTRRSLVGEFTFNGQKIFAFNSHLPSKGGSGDFYQLNQDNSSGNPANGDWDSRTRLAEDVWSVQNLVSTTITDGRVISGGDFNEFWFYRPLEVLTGYATADLSAAGTARVGGTRYSNLMVDKLAANERYSYDFDGRSQALDALLADQALAAVAEYDSVHINTGFNERAGAVNPASSDHDPSIARFDFRGFGEALNGAAGDDVIQGFAGDDAINGSDGNDTAVFAGSWLGFDVTNNGATVDDINAANGDEGTDTLTDVELLSFAGIVVAAADAVNDAPIGANDTNAGDALVEDVDGSAAGNVLTNDTDADLALGLGETLTVVGANAGTEASNTTFSLNGGVITSTPGVLFQVSGPTVINGTYGQLTINNNGNWSYALDSARPATNALAAGQTATESFVYDVSDAHGLTDRAEINLAIQGGNDVYTLQLLHLSDGEAGTLAPDTAPFLAALADRFEDQYVNSITLAGGDTFLPGPFLAAGTDPSVVGILNQLTGSTIGAGGAAPGVVDTAIHNLIGVEASGIGNHEWDLGSNVYLSSLTGGGFSGAQYVSISANLVLNPTPLVANSADPLNARFIQTVGVNVATGERPQDLRARIVPSAIAVEGGERIGLVGATTQILESISSPTVAEILGFPFGPGANGETNNMVLLAAQLQPVIDDLIAQGVNKIVLLSHLQQIQLEQQLATLLTGVDIILAAGSNTRLGDADDVAVNFPGHTDDFAGTYPLVTAGLDGKTTLIVNTDNEYTYLGRLVVDFDANGEIILQSVTDNVAINGAYASTAENVAEAWGTTVDNLEATAFAAGTRGNQVRTLTDAVDAVITQQDGNVFGYSNVYLEGERIQVRTQETNLGNVSADANAAVARDALGLTADHAIVSIKNGGGIRAQIGTIINNPDGTVTKVAPEVGGEVSQLDVANALRFNNRLMVFDTTPQGLLNILNSPNALAPNNGGFVQIGGVRFSYNPTLAAGSRVQDIVLVNESGQITATIADNGVIVPGAPSLITAVALNFTANGGDGYLVKANAENFRYVLTDGTLSAPVSEALNFTDPAVVPANAIGEQQAFAQYFQERYATPETAYNEADTVQALDTRIQNQAARTDTVQQGERLFLGTNGAETLTGTADAEDFNGLGGNDTVNAGNGNDTVEGGAGNDSLNGEDGDDIIEGGAGGDRIDGGIGTDTATYANAGSGVSASLFENRGFAGDATGDRFTGIENLTGSGFGDVLEGNSQVNVIRGGAGDDTVIGRGGLDSLFGDAGDDVFTFEGNQRFASIDGGTGSDTIVAADANTTINWASVTSVETVSADGFANVRILGTTGADTIDLTGVALVGIASVDGSAGNDTITGSAGNDNLLGSGGNDVVAGGNGNDTITGGTGTDSLTGGVGNDRFVFNRLDTVSTLARADVITDFAVGDVVDLSNWDAIAATTGVNDAFDFIGTSAFEVGVAGQLRYDVVGSQLRLFGDTNGDGRADFAILLNNVMAITDADIIL